MPKHSLEGWKMPRDDVRISLDAMLLRLARTRVLLRIGNARSWVAGIKRRLVSLPFPATTVA